MQILLFSNLLLVLITGIYCGPCLGRVIGMEQQQDCLDTLGYFTVTGGIFAGVEKTCEWVGQEVQPRCNDPAAKENCPVTCNTCRSTTTPFPLSVLRSASTDEPQICVDEEGDVYGEYYYYDTNNSTCYHLNLKPSGSISRLYQETSTVANSCNAQYFGPMIMTSWAF